MIYAVVSYIGSLLMANSINEFLILRCFSVAGHPDKAPLIKQIIWYPPLCGWIKCNTDGVA